MEIEKILTLNSILEGQQCKTCPFSPLCDVLVDSYREDICQVLEKLSIKGDNENEYTPKNSRN